jgi:hypothetical protein
MLRQETLARLKHAAKIDRLALDFSHLLQYQVHDLGD